MPYACVLFGCSNRSNHEKDRRFFRVPKTIIHKGDRVNDITKRRRERWLANLSLLSNGADSSNARVCSDHFVKGEKYFLLITYSSPANTLLTFSFAIYSIKTNSIRSEVAPRMASSILCFFDFGEEKLISETGAAGICNKRSTDK